MKLWHTLSDHPLFSDILYTFKLTNLMIGTAGR